MVDSLSAIATPTLLVDRGVLRDNIRRMAALARRAGVSLRPHAKTHKSVAIARLQRDAGASGLTVATVREAEMFAAAGFDDLLLTAPPTGVWRLERLTALAARARLCVTVDTSEAIYVLDAACSAAGVGIDYLWEVDCGVGRFGTPPGGETARTIAATCDTAKSCRFLGLLAFGGHAYAGKNAAEVAAAAADERSAVTDTIAELDARGIEAPVRSIGTTPTSYLLEDAEGITEIRPGNYVFHDATQVALGVVDKDACALSVLTTVLSRPGSDRVILDAGSKALAAEQISPLTDGFGFVLDHPELRIERLYEEQAIATVVGECSLRPGDRVCVVPNHACAALNLHDRMTIVEDGLLTDSWTIDARGWDPDRAVVIA